MQEQISAVTVRKTMGLIQVATACTYSMSNQSVWLLKNMHLSQLQGLPYRGKNKPLFSVQVGHYSISLAKTSSQKHFVCVCWSHNFVQLSLDVSKISIPQNGTESLTQKHSFSFWNCKTDFLSYFLGNTLWTMKNFTTGKELSRGFVTLKESSYCPSFAAQSVSSQLFQN